MAKFECYLCKSIFERKPSQVSNPVRPFCSRSCAATYNNREWPKRQLEGSCDICNKPIPRSQRFCSSACYQTTRTSTVTGSQAVVSWRQRAKARLVEYAGGACKYCGYDKCIDALVFHHLDPAQKDFGISGKSKSFEAMKLEVDKCILLCANCHFEEHSMLRGKGTIL